MKKKTLERILTIIKNIASDDEARLHLNGAQISYLRENFVLVEATDGHRAVMIPIEDAGLSRFAKIHGKLCLFPFNVMTSKDVLKRLPDDLTLAEQGSGLAIRSTHDISIGFLERSERFPNLSATDPKGEVAYEVAFNPKYLLEILKSMQEDKRQVGLKLRFRDPLGPIECVLGDGRALLMPMRL